MEEHGKEQLGYVANGNKNLKTYGASLAYNGETLKTASTKYTMVYLHDSSKDNTDIANNDTSLNTASQANYTKNTVIYGDTHRENSTAGIGSTSWYGDYSCFPGLSSPFSLRGGRFWGSSIVGLFSFSCIQGNSIYDEGFRPVLIAE